MPELKNQPDPKSANEFLQSIDDKQKKEDSFMLLKLMQELTTYSPNMWGDSIIGYINILLALQLKK